MQTNNSDKEKVRQLYSNRTGGSVAQEYFFHYVQFDKVVDNKIRNVFNGKRVY